jgi:heme/copper-type cytochrome/quinol oxidase subunit 2
MKAKRTISFTLFAAALVSSLLTWSLPVLAQCAMCKNAVTGSPEAAKLSQHLNFAILILLIPPVLIFCGIFVVAYRYRKSRGAAEAQSSPRSGARKKHGAEREAGGALA